jgi:hypothetical protein
MLTDLVDEVGVRTGKKQHRTNLHLHRLGSR